ncbi:hypothetical protein E7T09_08580 [Deinococcus sp. KSM4-11]|uniref:hypothetical protein n=1 Tax=Deinococcus sp. KSM4-11 TaxID=2568654 RepID=UPI0010A43066|nr:hypothetical protein [Deinococcus sp. KSM4-11]THF87200.1 hypothetical protein E7T09_08580 [Deinococcus sp. KSM4-11]
MMTARKIDQIGTLMVDEAIKAIHIRKGDPKPPEASVAEIMGHPGIYRIGKTYFDHQGLRCVKVTRLH